MVIVALNIRHDNSRERILPHFPDADVRLVPEAFMSELEGSEEAYSALAAQAVEALAGIERDQPTKVWLSGPLSFAFYLGVCLGEHRQRLPRNLSVIQYNRGGTYEVQLFSEAP